METAAGPSSATSCIVAKSTLRSVSATRASPWRTKAAVRADRAATPQLPTPSRRHGTVPLPIDPGSIAGRDAGRAELWCARWLGSLDSRRGIRGERSGMPGPMEGVKVVELGFWVAGPSCAAILGDWGADVVKVEPLDGRPVPRHVGLLRRGHRPGREPAVRARQPGQALDRARLRARSAVATCWTSCWTGPTSSSPTSGSTRWSGPDSTTPAAGRSPPAARLRQHQRPGPGRRRAPPGRLRRRRLLVARRRGGLADRPTAPGCPTSAAGWATT